MKGELIRAIALVCKEGLTVHNQKGGYVRLERLTWVHQRHYGSTETFGTDSEGAILSFLRESEE